MAHFSPTGSEESISMLFGYKNGATAVLTSSFDADFKNESELCFENGIIKYDRFSNDPIVLIKNKISKEDFQKALYVIEENERVLFFSKAIQEENIKFSGKIVTKISLVKNYSPAEEYHQKYLEKR